MHAAVALTANDGDLKGRVLRSRDSQPIADADVRVSEKDAKKTTNAHGAFEIEDLAPGTYMVIVTPPSGSPGGARDSQSWPRPFCA